MRDGSWCVVVCCGVSSCDEVCHSVSCDVFMSLCVAVHDMICCVVLRYVADDVECQCVSCAVVCRPS